MVKMDKNVVFGETEYPFYVRSGNRAISEFGDVMAATQADCFLMVVDSRVPIELRRQFQQVMARIARTHELVIQASEREKKLATVDRLAEAALSMGISRKTCVVAIGGGIVGNIAGLLAALLFRGIRLVHVPTTFLAMSDSVLSTKQGVNSHQGKNHLGAFHPPLLVWGQLDFLETLPTEEMQAAMCETIKNVLAIRPDYLEELDGLINGRGVYSDVELVRLLDFCIEAKMQVMGADVYEKHSGLVLEYGHTLGHALETLSSGQLRHGYAVGLGMLAAARISVELGFMSAADADVHLHLIEKNGAPTRYRVPVAGAEILDVLRKDNKRGYLPPSPGKHSFVLLERLGVPRLTGDSVLTQVEEREIERALTSIAAH